MLTFHKRKRLRVLIACEFSGVVRDAFRKRGHEAYSCDLLPSEGSNKYHLQDDIQFILNYRKWDLMIAHPPCTYLTNAGSKHLYVGGRYENGKAMERWLAMYAAVEFFNSLLQADIPKICIENPIAHKHARELFSSPYTQIIQPWQFGHPETKATCLWLKNLPQLSPTNIVSGRTPRVHHESPGPDRWKNRSRTLSGIASAFAAQWG